MNRTVCANPMVYPSQESDSLQDVDGRDQAETENLVLSSFGSRSLCTIEDSLSLNSSALPPDVFDGIENMNHGLHGSDDHGGSTILSSIPSGASNFHFPPPEANRDIFILSPHPNLTTNGTQSLSTTNTELYASERLFQETTLGDRSCDDEGSLPCASSLSTDVDVSVTRDRPILGSFEHGAFERVADHLMFDSSDDCSANRWHDCLVSDSDWDRFRATSKDLLRLISEDSESVSPNLLPLPPIPEARVVAASSERILEVTYQAEDFLPSDFVCGICKDVLVGACILDCNCCSSTVCMSCWKEADCDRQDLATRMDFVWVESKKRCPSCHCNAEIKAYCHALDVAILRIIQDLPDSDVSLSCLKQKYYSRLSTWRETVSDRNERYRREQSFRDDELLARLIQEEERVFWDATRSRTRKRSFFSSNKFRVFSQALLALIAAAGLKHMSKR